MPSWPSPRRTIRIARRGRCVRVWRSTCRRSTRTVVAALEPVVAQLKTPDNLAEAQFLLGVSQFYLDQFDAAVPALQAALKASPKWRQADETLLFLSRALRKQDKTDEAHRRRSRKLIADLPQSRLLDQAHYRYGEYCLRGGRLQDGHRPVRRGGRGRRRFAFRSLRPVRQGLGSTENQSVSRSEPRPSHALVKSHPQHTLIADTHFALGMCLRQAGEFDGGGRGDRPVSERPGRRRRTRRRPCTNAAWPRWR